jgi:thiamine transport system permease protein
MSSPNWGRGALLLLLIAFFITLLGGVVWPLLRWLSEGFTLSWPELFGGDSELWAIANVTLKQALLSTLGSALLGIPLGLWVGGLHSQQGDSLALRWARGALRFPFIAPGSAAATAYLALIGTQGVLTGWLWPESWVYSFASVVFSHIAINFTWVAVSVAEERAQISPRLLEAARVLGAGPLSRFKMLWLPELAPTVVSTLVFVFQLCVVSFSLVMLMGGGPPVETLETSIYSQIQISGGEWQGAFGLGLLQLTLTLFPVLGVVLLNATVFKRHGARQRIRALPLGQRGTSSKPVQSWGAALVGLAVGVVPYFAIGVSARTEALGDSELSTALLRSLTLLSLSLPLGLFLGIVSSFWTAELYRSKGVASKISLFTLESAVALTPGVSAMVLSLAFWRAYGEWVDPFAGSLWSIAIIQGLGVYPLIHRSLFPLFSSPQVREREAARVLGASAWGAFWVVEWPRLRPAIAGISGLAGGLLLGEVSSVSFFKGEGGTTLPLLIGQWIRQYRFEDAISASLVLMALGAIWVWGVPALLGRSSR